MNFCAKLLWLVVWVVYLKVVTFTVNVKGATHWRLEDGRLNEIVGEQNVTLEKDPIFKMLVDAWSPASKLNKNSFSEFSSNEKTTTSSTFSSTAPAYEIFKSHLLTCGDPVNETSIDNIRGVVNRFVHPVYSEPDVFLLFRGNEFETASVDVIESNLINAVKVGENRVVLFNLVGNFLRIKGDTYHSIECFRSAMHASSSNPDALLNLARIMMNLNYSADAVYLAEYSLRINEPNVNTWLQHYALAEIFEQTGELEKSWTHFSISVDQNPTFPPVYVKLNNLNQHSTIVNFNMYTLALVLLLCISILLYFTVVYPIFKL
ncbi:uncharacterized protein LOC105848042 [Hydra vulgaris]|uniref:uncharacterized protein LOC105848042 n=1 Tax=Hydra vulgaris TaxID=6087 RepID=UPI001F5EA3BA|nr:uncharacterized protein LOC105848042 [Hydra vulgaris]